MRKTFYFPLALPFFLLLVLLPLFLLALAALLGLAVADVAGRALGLSPLAALLVYLAMLAGSLVNVPVYEFKSSGDAGAAAMPYPGTGFTIPRWRGRRTVICVNLGGCLIPAALGAYFALGLPPLELLAATLAVALGVYYFARPVRSAGIAVPVLAPPLLAVGASLAALYIAGAGFDGLARMAFATGVFGTILGADILHLGDIRRIGADSLSLGGAGTFDGIVLSGVLGTILAAIVAGA